MTLKMKIGIVGDYNDSFIPHRSTNDAINHVNNKLGLDIGFNWLPTDTIEADFESIIKTYKGFWIAPGSPYKSMSGALKIIEYARLNNIPTLGTCGGFQHMIIEFARNVLHIEDAAHEEYNPYASKLVVNKLECSLKGKVLEIEIIDEHSKTFGCYKSTKIFEKYYCDFGLNPIYQEALHKKGFKVVGIDTDKEARIIELENHPFFIAILFVPQDNSSENNPHNLVSSFIKEVLKR
ncbi:MAG: hypothetical protein JWQ09_2362 [Segetibacter sp.]|nr:hypothetical protein [Segetibacter sp.]